MIMKTIFLILSLFFQEPEVPKYTQKDLHCMAHAVYHEARGETQRGQAAVAHVVLNRQQSGLFPPTICGVVYQPHQFTDIRKTHPNFKSKAWQNAMTISAATLAGVSKDPTKGAKYFYAHMVIKPKWSQAKAKVRIGNHTFI
jgi:N-acetylmuramoyl-L-alanine amidase